MEEAKKRLFQTTQQRFTLWQLTKHQQIGSGQKNLVELMTRFPGNGKGFRVSKKTWPENCYYDVTEVHLMVSFGRESGESLRLEWSICPLDRHKVLEGSDGVNEVRHDPGRAKARTVAF